MRFSWNFDDINQRDECVENWIRAREFVTPNELNLEYFLLLNVQNRVIVVYVISENLLNIVGIYLRSCPVSF